MRFALVAAALLTAGPAYAQHEGAVFDFKGVRLGITLDEMRLTRASDPRLANAHVVCSGDPQVGVMHYLRVQLRPEETAAGVRRCAYFEPPGVTGYAEIAPLNMGGGDTISRDYQFDFFPDPETRAPRLYRIVLRTHARARRDVLPALTDRFGDPTEISTEPVQAASGAIIAQTVTEWRVPGAVLSVVTPSGRLDRMSIVYVLTDLARQADAAIAAERRANPNRM